KSEIIAGGPIIIRGDTRRNRKNGQDVPDDTNADPNFGTNMDFSGVIGGYFVPETNPGATPDRTDLPQIFGHTDVDLITFNQTFRGDKTRVYGSQYAVLAKAPGGNDVPDGEDLFTVNQLQTMDVAAGHTLTLDGQAESDTYVVNTTGSQHEGR